MDLVQHRISYRCSKLLGFYYSVPMEAEDYIMLLKLSPANLLFIVANTWNSDCQTLQYKVVPWHSSTFSYAPNSWTRSTTCGHFSVHTSTTTLNLLILINRTAVMNIHTSWSTITKRNSLGFLSYKTLQCTWTHPDIPMQTSYYKDALQFQQSSPPLHSNTKQSYNDERIPFKFHFAPTYQNSHEYLL